MSRFSEDWLAAREPVDARSRSSRMTAGLEARYPAIVDLGAGTGANLRWLAPKLGFGQRWQLIDNDRRLLATGMNLIRDWVERKGGSVSGSADALEIAGPGFSLSVNARVLDLAKGLESFELPEGALVTGSALLDLVSRPWLEQLMGAIVSRRASALFALSFTGSVSLYPRHATDSTVVAAVNRHQLTDKGFGPALGPGAHAVARDLLTEAGWDVTEIDSSWRLGPGDRRVLHPLVDGWSDAALELMPDESDRIAGWRRHRARLAATRACRVTVSHRDLVAVPQGRMHP